jgi:hypothetical protein
MWNSLKPAPLTEADFLGALTARHSACNCVLCEMDRRVIEANRKVLFGWLMPDRTIQDNDITTMIEFIKGAAMGRTVADSLIVMLEELLILRKKMRDAA